MYLICFLNLRQIFLLKGINIDRLFTKCLLVSQIHSSKVSCRSYYFLFLYSFYRMSTKHVNSTYTSFMEIQHLTDDVQLQLFGGDHNLFYRYKYQQHHNQIQ